MTPESQKCKRLFNYSPLSSIAMAQEFLVCNEEMCLVKQRALLKVLFVAKPVKSKLVRLVWTGLSTSHMILSRGCGILLILFGTALLTSSYFKYYQYSSYRSNDNH